MDRDLRYSFYGLLGFGAAVGGAAGGIAVFAPGLGGTIICGGGTVAAGGTGGAVAGGAAAVGGTTAGGTAGAAATGTGASIVFGHGAGHLIGTGLSQLQVEAAIIAQLRTLAGLDGAGWHWIQINGQWIQYRIHILADGTINVGTCVPVPGPLMPK